MMMMMMVMVMVMVVMLMMMMMSSKSRSRSRSRSRRRRSRSSSSSSGSGSGSGSMNGTPSGLIVWNGLMRKPKYGWHRTFHPMASSRTWSGTPTLSDFRLHLFAIKD